MQRVGFVIVFSIIMLMWGAVNYYIFVRGAQAFQFVQPWRSAYIITAALLTVSFFAGRFLERYWFSWISCAMVQIGALWMAAVVYLLLFIVAIDFLRLVNHFLPFFPAWITSNPKSSAQWSGIVVAVAVLFITLAGAVNALYPRVKNLAIEIPKPAERENLRVVVASDIHLGTIISNSRLERIVNLINDQEPDLILLAGDQIDEDLAPVIRMNLGETLRTLSAPLGVYAITGNHEYIGGVEPAVNYLAEHGIHILRDTSVTVAGITIVGREDRSIGSFTSRKRKTIEEVMQGVDTTKPVIVMDHQPFGLDEAASSGADIQLSGHTHHGQLWPFNYITQKVYEVSWGYTSKNGTHIYVSSGAGTWGPPVRTGNTPEIVILDLTFSRGNDH